jgi:hypothetical protein
MRKPQALWLIPFIVLLSAVSLVALWSLVLAIISLTGGWWQLAGSYRAPTAFAGQRWTWQSGWFGWARYSGVLTVGADSAGLSLEIMSLFRIMHPALFIPGGHHGQEPPRAAAHRGPGSPRSLA